MKKPKALTVDHLNVGDPCVFVVERDQFDDEHERCIDASSFSVTPSGALLVGTDLRDGSVVSPRVTFNKAAWVVAWVSKVGPKAAQTPPPEAE